MGAGPELIVPLDRVAEHADEQVGGKARGLGRLIAAGLRVPAGFCLTVPAYERFVTAAGIAPVLRMELGRKPFAAMRWEEIWDAALRIRTAFLGAPLPDAVAAPLRAAYRALAPGPVAVRSSAPGEDAAGRSHAGLHESVVGVTDEAALLDAVRIVWASLWSDAALLYRQELGLDVARSRMAVVVQEFAAADVSGVGFGIDPVRPRDDRQLVEAVPGACEDLVSGAVEPDRWVLARSTGEVLAWTPGRRGGTVGAGDALLNGGDLDALHRTLRTVERLLDGPPDLEWTGRSADLVLLQARPATGGRPRQDERDWYLTLRPGDAALRALCERVAEELIPALAGLAETFAATAPETLDDAALAAAITARAAADRRWQRVYRDEFIPFAHGVRRFGTYYNDAVRPHDPYEFVALLEHEPMLAATRNAALEELAARLRAAPAVAVQLDAWTDAGCCADRADWEARAGALDALPGGAGFRRAFDDWLDGHLDLAYGDEALNERPDLGLAVVRQLASGPPRATGDGVAARDTALERLLAAVGPEREDEARDMLRIARLSWRLRDDDNILMGRLRNQLQRALDEAAARLRRAGRLTGPVRPTPRAANVLAEALRHGGDTVVALPAPPTPAPEPREPAGVTPRQLTGQPAAGGVASGTVRVVREAADFKRFRRGEVMVCDAIQPTMTHLVPLAAAIVERRGGMLIHGAIIARELGVPCVNGVPDATRLLRDGDLVTVDGHLGIVTVGEPEFGIERAADAGAAPA